MKAKIFSLIVLAIMTLSVMSVTVLAGADFCNDSNASTDPFVGGSVTTEKGVSNDDCDGASDNLKEFYCDGDKAKFKTPQIDCGDFNAVCVSEDGPDHCGCTEGNHLDGKSCVPDSQIPEFSAIAAGIAVSGAGVGYLALRRRK
ncbi:MAG: hypothetical protein EPN86_03755 [Nanoarchaeota archaeon]|nr:MAG: hypothetical protein EPN86_03755 [Nanoarchaeota archaeon]